MSIYNVGGSQTTSAFNVSGNALNYAFNKDGAAVYQKGYDYDDYSISNMFSLSGSSFQGFAIHGDVIAQFQADDKVRLVKTDGASVASQMSVESYHGQSAFFMNDYYAEGDEFPLLMVMGSYTNAWINRITRTGSTLVKTIYIPATVENGGYKLGNAYDSSNNHMFTLGYTEQNYQTDDGGANKLIIAEWNLNNLTDNGDDTYTPELIATIQRDFLICIQGSCYYDGMIWASSGLGTAAAHIYALNPSTAEILHTITLSNDEIEGCAWADGYLIAGMKPTNIAYKKITFSEATT